MWLWMCAAGAGVLYARRGETPAYCVITVINKAEHPPHPPHPTPPCVSEHTESYGKYLSPKDTAPDVLRLMGAIIGGQDSGVGLIKLGCNPAPSTY